MEDILKDFRTPYPNRISLGLERIEAIMSHLDNPQDKYPSFHIAGTNGKGSVSAMLYSIFQELGLKVGLFTSPHLERFTERIQINKTEITEETFREIFQNKIIPLLPEINPEEYGNPTEFEVINAIAYYYFEQQKIDLGIFEVGLGGRLDSSNVLKEVLISVITSISFDHMDRLGNTLSEITYEKAGIIKPNIPVVTTINQVHPEVLEAKGSPVNYANPNNLVNITNNLEFESNPAKNISYPISYRKLRYEQKESLFYNQEISFPLWGMHQNENLAIVLETLNLFFSNENMKSKLKLEKLTKDQFIQACLSGIKKTYWPGRFELVSYFNHKLILDGAHNDKGMDVFIKTLSELKQDYKVITIFACNKDKEFQPMIDKVSSISDYIILTKSHVEVKAKDPEEISVYLTNKGKDHKIIKDYNQTIDFACRILTEKGFDIHKTFICICGSLYLVGAIRAYLNSLN